MSNSKQGVPEGEGAGGPGMWGEPTVLWLPATRPGLPLWQPAGGVAPGGQNPAIYSFLQRAGASLLHPLCHGNPCHFLWAKYLSGSPPATQHFLGCCVHRRVCHDLLIERILSNIWWHHFLPGKAITKCTGRERCQIHYFATCCFWSTLPRSLHNCSGEGP